MVRIQGDMVKYEARITSRGAGSVGYRMAQGVNAELTVLEGRMNEVIQQLGQVIRAGQGPEQLIQEWEDFLAGSRQS